MALLDQPVIVVGYDGKDHRATALHVDFAIERVFCRLDLENGCCSAWFAVDSVRLIDDAEPM